MDNVTLKEFIKSAVVSAANEFISDIMNSDICYLKMTTKYTPVKTLLQLKVIIRERVLPEHGVILTMKLVPYEAIGNAETTIGLVTCEACRHVNDILDEADRIAEEFYNKNFLNMTTNVLWIDRSESNTYMNIIAKAIGVHKDNIRILSPADGVYEADYIMSICKWPGLTKINIISILDNKIGVRLSKIIKSLPTPSRSVMIDISADVFTGKSSCMIKRKNCEDIPVNVKYNKTTNEFDINEE